MLLKLKSGFLNLALYQVFFMLVMVNANGEKIDDLHIKKSSTSTFNMEDQIFFTPNDLKIGKQMGIYFGSRFASEIPRLLPREKADLIPFSLQSLPFLVEYYGFVPESPQAKAMETTLKLCETKREGEAMLCATSLESMTDFTRKTFTSIRNNALTMLRTSPLPKNTKLLQNYTIVKQPQQIPSPNIVECHMLPYPYAVYQCYHYPEPEYKVYKISLRGEDGTYVNAMGNCHMDNSFWDPNDASFRILGLKPGESPICHFLPSTDLVWIPAATVDAEENYIYKSFTN